MSDPRIRAWASVDSLGYGLFLVVVNDHDCKLDRRVYTLTARDDTTAAMDGIARYVEEMEQRANGD